MSTPRQMSSGHIALIGKSTYMGDEHCHVMAPGSLPNLVRCGVPLPFEAEAAQQMGFYCLFRVKRQVEEFVADSRYQSQPR
jgi:hypothetical protein